MLTKSCEYFLEQLASGNAVPGGGGASAFCGALGIALGSMVCNFTLGKKKYADVQQDIGVIIEKADALRLELQSLVSADAQAFEPLSIAYGLPKTTPQEISDRDKIMEECLKNASAVPLKIMECITRAVVMLEELAIKGSRITISDVGVGAALCRAALDGASLNVYINTKLMQNRALAAENEALADSMLAEFLPRCENTLQSVKNNLRK